MTRPRLTSTRRLGRPLVCALTLAAGHADLARGGTTLAPILLVLGYCVLVPAALLSDGFGRPEGDRTAGSD
jgi:hypothetical protein